MDRVPFPSRLSRARVLRAAFGMVLPQDDESTEDEFAEASKFDPKGYAYADGGEVPEAKLGRKREADTGVSVDDPDYQLPVYRGETAKKRDEQAEREKKPKDLPALAAYANGGAVEADSSWGSKLKRWLSSSEDDAAGAGKAVAEKAIDSTSGLAKQSADAIRRRNAVLEQADRLAASNARGGIIQRRSSGGQIDNPRPTFADAMVRRMKFGRSSR